MYAKKVQLKDSMKCLPEWNFLTSIGHSCLDGFPSDLEDTWNAIRRREFVSKANEETSLMSRV